MTRATKDGAQITNEGDILILKWKDRTMCFDYKVNTKNGHIMAAIIQPAGVRKGMDRDRAVNTDVNKFHAVIIHRNKKDLARTAKKLNFNLTGKLNYCVHCGQGKTIKS